ncbi:MAG: hypothetical protein ACLT2Z_00060 [Eubacterium sp.]
MDTQIRKNEIWSIGERLEDWEFDLVIKFINMDKKNKIMLYASVLSDDEELGEAINSGDMVQYVLFIELVMVREKSCRML